MNLINYAKRGRTLVFSQSCTVQRSIGDASGYSVPVDLHANVGCSLVYEMSPEEVEKGWLTTTSRPLKIFADIPVNGEIKEHDVIVINGENYFVIKANRWPHSDPSYYELIVDYRRGQ